MQISGPYTWLKLTGSLKKTGRAPLPNDIGTLSVIDNKTSAVISCWPWLFTIRNLSTLKMIFTITQLNFITNKSRNKNTSYILSYLWIFYSSLIILFPIKQSGVMPPWLQSIFNYSLLWNRPGTRPMNRISCQNDTKVCGENKLCLKIG